MNPYAGIFYILAAVILLSTGLAVTRRNLMHAIVYLVLSFFGTALLFYLLGAPFLAALEVIIYAGAIMVLFLFIVMMLEIRPAEGPLGSYLRQWLPALVLGALSLAVLGLIIFKSGGDLPLPLAAASPLEFGRFLFQRYWFSVEIVSFLLLVALVGALYLGKREE
jgi:NADH-quinone oxidoreductase subunit J